jgi:hypothetical protein
MLGWVHKARRPQADRDVRPGHSGVLSGEGDGSVGIRQTQRVTLFIGMRADVRLVAYAVWMR